MKSETGAFSRVDLLMCVCAVSFIFLLASSLVASNKYESQRVICFNNLRQIGRAFHVWGNDHDDQLPWQADVNSGGTFRHPLGPNRWWQFSWISNQLGSPKILACPADPAARTASNWGLGADGGFLNAAYRNNALSYPLFLHALANSPQSLLAGDQNMRVDVRSTVCTYLPSRVCFQLVPYGVAAWTNAIHGTAGHLLFMDGSVRFTTSAELQQVVTNPGTDDNGSTHGL